MNGLAGPVLALGAPNPLLEGANGFAFPVAVLGAPNDENGPAALSAPNAGAEPNTLGAGAPNGLDAGVPNPPAEAAALAPPNAGVEDDPNGSVDVPKGPADVAGVLSGAAEPNGVVVALDPPNGVESGLAPNAPELAPIAAADEAAPKAFDDALKAGAALELPNPVAVAAAVSGAAVVVPKGVEIGAGAEGAPNAGALSASEVEGAAKAEVEAGVAGSAPKVGLSTAGLSKEKALVAGVVGVGAENTFRSDLGTAAAALSSVGVASLATGLLKENTGAVFLVTSAEKSAGFEGFEGFEGASLSELGTPKMLLTSGSPGRTGFGATAGVSFGSTGAAGTSATTVGALNVKGAAGVLSGFFSAFSDLSPNENDGAGVVAAGVAGSSTTTTGSVTTGGAAGVSSTGAGGGILKLNFGSSSTALDLGFSVDGFAPKLNDGVVAGSAVFSATISLDAGGVIAGFSASETGGANENAGCSTTGVVSFSATGATGSTGWISGTVLKGFFFFLSA